jgi:DNA-binding MarR family transcriptional regulator
MTKQEQIKFILYEAADKLAAVLAEDDTFSRDPPEPPKPQEWLSRKELIERLGIAPGTATRIIKKLEEKGVGVVRFGKGVRVDLEEVKRQWKKSKQN